MTATRRPSPLPPGTTLDVDVCAIGAGSGGLAISRFATAAELSCVLVERGAMGGDCLNGGCVPSKALLAAGHAAAAVRRARGFGIDASIRLVSGRRVYQHVRDTVAAIEPNDSQEHYEGLGTTVLREHAAFVGPGELAVGSHRVRARHFFVATGASAVVPPIRGIESVPYLTHETIFTQSSLPRNLVIIGAGPVGVEMAQAHRRLGARVTLLEQATMLPNEDPELVEHLRARLLADGVRIVERSVVLQASASPRGVVVKVLIEGVARKVGGSHLLVAAGRRPQVEGLALDRAGVEFSARGIVVDRHLRTTNPRVYAIGDVIGQTQLSHLAVHHAAVAFANAVKGVDIGVSAGMVPRVLFTEPELAQVGQREAEARRDHRDVRVLRWRYDHNDRAVAERSPWGMVKIVLDPGGRILGAGIVGPRAGEVIQKWTLAISAGLDIRAVAEMIAPYPTIGYSDRKLAESFAGPTLLAKHGLAVRPADSGGASRQQAIEAPQVP